MRDTAERWKNVSTELRCVHSMLEELILYWTRWETLSGELEQWMRVAYTKLNLPEDEKLEFFKVSQGNFQSLILLSLQRLKWQSLLNFQRQFFT